MSDTIDHAEALTRRERDACIARVQAAMAAPGATECDDCGNIIAPARRAAMPSAVRCAACQARREKGGRV